MNIHSILTPERTHYGLQAASKKRAIEEAAGLIAADVQDLAAGDIYEQLMNREKLGTTAIGHAIAIPHCRVAACSGIVGSLFKLASPVDFDAFDDEPVSVLFVLLVPTEEVDEHLQALAMLARKFESEPYRKRLMSASDDRSLYEAAVADENENSGA
ncbi:MAG: PTS sugar transporter subunit IIA [Pseudomonadales bacterium]|nr:PTS sugar transporter subunit IIA [Pseudomonadales bacterium]